MLSDFASGINVFRGEGPQNPTGQASGDEAPGSLSGPPDGSSPSAPPAGPPDGSSSSPPSDPLADDSGLSKGQPERVFPKEPREESEKDRNSNHSQTVDDILDGAELGRDTKGKTVQYVKSGSYEQTVKDFEALAPEKVKKINTKFGPAKTGILPDGRRITARRGSSDGRPTLEIRKSNGRGIEIRYGRQRNGFS